MPVAVSFSACEKAQAHFLNSGWFCGLNEPSVECGLISWNRERKSTTDETSFFSKSLFFFFSTPGNDRRSRQRRRWRNQWSWIPSYHEKDEFVLKHCHSLSIYVHWCKRCCVKCTEPETFPCEEKPLYHLGHCHITINKFPYLWWFLNHCFWQLCSYLWGWLAWDYLPVLFGASRCGWSAVCNEKRLFCFVLSMLSWCFPCRAI